MSPDTAYSLLVVALLGLTIAQKQFSAKLLEVLLALTRPGATLLFLGLMVLAYSRGYLYTFFALALLSTFLLRDLWTSWVRSDARRLHLEIARDQARFDPATSVDLQVANGSLGFAAPSMLKTSVDASPLLVFPPSSSTLAELNGN